VAIISEAINSVKTNQLNLVGPADPNSKDSDRQHKQVSWPSREARLPGGRLVGHHQAWVCGSRSRGASLLRLKVRLRG